MIYKIRWEHVCSEKIIDLHTDYKYKYIEKDIKYKV